MYLHITTNGSHLVSVSFCRSRNTPTPPSPQILYYYEPTTILRHPCLFDCPIFLRKHTTRTTRTTHKHTCNHTHTNLRPPLRVHPFAQAQRERDAREARQLDREIRAQERHYQAAAAESRKGKHAGHSADAGAAAGAGCTVAGAGGGGTGTSPHEPGHLQFGQAYRGLASSSERTSAASTPPTTKSSSRRDSDVDPRQHGGGHHTHQHHHQHLHHQQHQQRQPHAADSTTSESARNSVASISHKVSSIGNILPHTYLASSTPFSTTHV